MLRAVLYLRLSVTVDDSTSIVRQETDLRALAEREGWDVVAVLVDDGLSGRKARANAETAVRMLADDDADVLAVWKLDRFTRQGWDGLGALSRTLDARERSGRPARFVALQDGLSSDSPAFRLVAGVLSEVARSEADNTAARARSAIHYRRTVADRYTGGASVPFGYASIPASDGVGRVLVPHEEEAGIVREVTDRILSEESLSRIAADLTARGIPTSKSPARRGVGTERGRWTVSTIRALWSSDLLLGRVRHRGDLVRDADGLPRSVWPPLVDLDTLERLRARLTPAQPRPQRRRASRLLSGLAYCDVCDSKLYVTTTGQRAAYACGSSWNGTDCPSPKITAEPLERFVVERFLALVGDLPEFETVERVHGPSPAALREIEAALREATERLLDDDADMVAVAQRINALKAQRATLRAQPSEITVEEVPTGRTRAEAWTASLDDAQRRALLLTALDHVRVAPMVRRGGDPAERATLVWTS